MIKMIILLFILTTQLFSFDSGKFKAKQKGDYIYAKFLLKHPMITYFQAIKTTGDKKMLNLLLR